MADQPDPLATEWASAKVALAELTDRWLKSSVWMAAGPLWSQSDAAALSASRTREWDARAAVLRKSPGYVPSPAPAGGGGPTADVQAPSAAFALGNLGSLTAPKPAWFLGADPVISGQLWAGIKESRLFDNGVLLTTVSAPGTGLQLTMAGASVGSPVGGSSSRSGVNLVLASQDSGRGSMSDQGQWFAGAVSGDGIGYMVVDSFTSSVAGSVLTLEARGGGSANAPYVAIVIQPSNQGGGVSFWTRAGAGAAAIQQPGGATWSTRCDVVLFRTGGDWAAYVATDSGVTYAQFSGATLPMTDPVQVGSWLSSGSPGTSVSVTVKQWSWQNLAQQNYLIPSPIAGHTYQLTVTVRDQNNNESAVSPLLSIAVPGGGGGGGGGQNSFPGPMTGVLLNGGEQWIPTYNDDAVSNFNVLLLGAGGDQMSGHGTRQALVTRLKAAQSAKGVFSLVGQYFNYGDVGITSGYASDTNWRNDVIGYGWLIWQSGTSGAISYASFDPSTYYESNRTRFCPTAPNSNYPYQQAGQRSYDYLIAGLHGSWNQANNLDFVWNDVSNAYAESMTWPYDISRANLYPGIALGDDSRLFLPWLQGTADLLNKQKALFTPVNANIMVGANSGDWWQRVQASGVGGMGAAAGISRVGLQEFAIGKFAGQPGEGLLNSNGTTYMLNQVMMPCLSAMAANPVLMIEHCGLTATGTDPSTGFDVTPYKALRHGLSFCMTVPGGVHTQLPTFTAPITLFNYDEYHCGTANIFNWLGTRQSATWTLLPNGVYLTFWEKGFVAHNPKGNGAQNVTTANLGGSGLYRRLTGTQDAVRNNGTLFNATFSVPDGDGYFGKSVAVYG